MKVSAEGGIGAVEGQNDQGDVVFPEVLGDAIAIEKRNIAAVDEATEIDQITVTIVTDAADIEDRDFLLR
jgi:hypothetical protein